MTAAVEPMNNDSLTARREERLLRLLERASASSRFNLGEKWLFGVGGALVVAGFVVVVIGWAGASRTVLVAGQIPYLISGGLIGLGLIFLGAFLYFGHWVAVLVRESRERGAEDRDDLATVRGSLQEINRSLTILAAALAPEAERASTAERAPAAERAAATEWGAVPSGSDVDLGGTGEHPQAQPVIELRGDDTAPVLLATTTGTMAHRPGCRALAGKPNIRPVSVRDGLKPCGMCRPLDHVVLR